jgi:hypothetical protein
MRARPWPYIDPDDALVERRILEASVGSQSD